IASKDWWLGLGGVVLGGASALSTLWERSRIRSWVTFDDEKVERTSSDGTASSVRWDDLQKVAIITNSYGPGAEDLFFILVGKGEAVCAIPHSAEGMHPLLARLQQLRGFDNESVIRAMGSTSEAVFACWTRTD